MPRYAQVVGWGKCLPQRVLTNRELEVSIDTTDAWIQSRTGIKERRIASDSETASSLAVPAARMALETAHVSPESVDLVIVATATPDRIFPSCAATVQNALGARKAGAFDINAACTGFMYALVTACQFVTSGTFKNVLVIGSEVYSRILDWKDRSTCVLFGDGAGAVLVQASDDAPGMLGFVLGSDGSGADMLYVPGPCGTPQSSPNGRYFLAMNGPEVFRFAITTTRKATQQAVAASGLTMSDIDLFVSHQANSRIIWAAAKSLGLPPERVFTNVEQYGNTSAASIPIALCEAVEQGKLHAGNHVALVGFGGGLSWGAAVLRWTVN
ncbi:MAG: beta-ketoacyl-ACP synthase III [Dehalococcoidia bacterium]|nr:beta-ketoacyl-ACP synthase III [Dehalococcoidia bacterium]